MSCTSCAALTATLGKVRAMPRWTPCEVDAEDEDGPLFQGFLTDTAGEWVKVEDLEAALSTAGSPDAGQTFRDVYGNEHTLAADGRCTTPPEPKGPEQEEYCDNCEETLRRDECLDGVCRECWFKLGDDLSAANARADAAEREMRESREVAVRNATDCQHLRQSAIALATERDQLAVQVERIGAIVSGMIPPQGIPGPSQRLLLRVREELGLRWPQ